MHSGIIYFVLPILLTVYSCDFIEDLLKRNNDEQPNKVIIVLFDLSESTNKPEVRSVYSNGFNRIVSSITHGDVLFAGWITERSGVELDFPIQYEIPPLSIETDNPLIVRRIQDKADLHLSDTLQVLHSLIDSLLQNTARQVWRTDILSSLELAERIFKNYPQHRSVMVLFSDMIEDSFAYNFERENLTSQRIKTIIENERKNDRTPDLADVRIYVIGAYHHDVNRYRMIRNFWFSYLEECGAEINSENYGPQLIRFDE